LKGFKLFLLILFLVFFTSGCVKESSQGGVITPIGEFTVNITVNPDQDRTPISPYIYGANQSETAPSSRWAEVKFRKNAPLSLNPDTSDNYVYMDELLNYLISKYGKANTSTGIKGYLLDNEPDLWSSTHPRIHPNKVSCSELISKSIELAKVIKDMDPDAMVFGYESYGFMGYYSLQDAPDWNSVKGNHEWFIGYYLQKMKEASDSYGKRLLDVLSLH